MKIIFLIPSFIFFSFIFYHPVLAVTVDISNAPSSITDQPFEFNVSVSGAGSGTNYLRADFYQPGTTNYFGYTFNGNDFYTGSDYAQYLPITINPEGSASATIKAKLDPSSSSFKGAGSYNLKVRRYTSSGSSYTWSNETTVNVNYSLPTSTPIPAPTSAPTDTPTPTSSPTNTPTPTSTSKPSPTKTPTPKPSPTKTKTPTPEPSIPSSILGTASANLSPTSTPVPQAQTSSSPLKNILLVGGGLIFLLAAGLLTTFIVKRKPPEI
ncbi:MAG: hypothetical protein V1808_02895 [Candidatus Daviesbacteria bacterium]